MGDTGVLEFGGETIVITDTKKENDLFIQFSDVLPDNLTARVTAKVDKEGS